MKKPEQKQDESGEWYVVGDVGCVKGSVWGDVKGDVWGNVEGTINGRRWMFVEESNDE